jgi:hypothetical protein
MGGMLAWYVCSFSFSPFFCLMLGWDWAGMLANIILFLFSYTA